MIITESFEEEEEKKYIKLRQFAKFRQSDEAHTKSETETVQIDGQET